jgi:hypothetical protein
MKQLTKFAIEVRMNDFVFRLTDDDGEVVEFATSVEQLDHVISVLNDLMDEADADD